MRYIFALLIFVFSASAGMAGIEKYTSRIEGSQIITSASFTVFDGKYSEMLQNPSTWQNSFTNASIRNKVRIGLNPEVVQTSNITGTIQLRITPYSWVSGAFVAGTAVTPSFQVTYSTTAANVIDELATYSLSGANKLLIEVLSVPGGYNTSAIFIEGEVEVERYYKHITTTLTTPTVTSSGEYLEFRWPAVKGAESYEIEYLHVNDYKALSAASQFTASDLSYNFYRSAVRVNINTSYYKLQNIFDKGYVLFRVRTVGKTSDGKYRREGDWSAAESGIISSHPSSQRIQITDEYDKYMNWSYQSTITENGKRTDAVSYSDGLGRPHQVTTYNPVTNQALVSNVYYDKIGRPAVSDLPTPLTSSELVHHPNFNKGEDGQPYGPQHFESVYDEENCVYTTSGFSLTDGAGAYYSANSALTNENIRIPDAEKYPFTRILYDDDFTGRIKRAGAYGPDFKVGEGHDTEFRYATPTQEELDRLFGTEVGYYKHYQKKTVIDANGQAYIEYFDMSGRVIASGIIGVSPANLSGIGAGTTEDPEVISSGESGTVTPVSMTLSQPVDIFATADYTFTYNLTPTGYQDECMEEICFDCHYKLKVTLKDNCNEEVYSDELSINGATYNDMCTGTSLFSNAFTLNLTPKSYTLVKELTIDESAVNEYWCTYLENNTCIEEPSDIFEDLYSTADFSDCEPIEEEVEYANECDARKAIMLMDMKPAGQYATYTGTGTYTSSSNISILTDESGNVYPVDWNSSSMNYMDADLVTPALIEITEVSPGVYSPAITGSPVSGPLPNGKYTAYPKQLVSLTDFINLFQDSWAEALLPYHPEFCYLNYCISADAGDSRDYDAAMMEVKEHGEACSGGWYAPRGTSIYTTSTQFSTCATSGHIDPFFLSIGSAYATAMNNKLQNYQTLGGTPYSMLDFAIREVLEPNSSNPIVIDRAIEDLDLACYGDAIWFKFRDLYLYEKMHFYALAEEANVTGCSVPHNYIGNTAISNPFSNAEPRWGQTLEMLETDYSQPGDDPFLQSTGDGAAACQTICEAYVQEWLTNLDDCDPLVSLETGSPTLYEDLEEDLVSVCVYGCSTTHPAGAITLPPVITPTSFVVNGGTLYGGQGVKEVLAFYSISETDLCTELLITKPGPYKEDVIPDYKLDNCGCDILMEARQEFEAAIGLPSGTTIEDYLASTRNISLDDVNAMLCACDKVVEEWTTEHVWTNGEIESILAHDINVPPSLACEKCTDCETVGLLMDDLETRFGSGFYESENYGLIVQNYLNQELGFTLSKDEYLEFLKHCAGASTPYCEPSEEVAEWVKVMNLIVHRGQLTSGSPIDLETENIVYANSAVKTILAQNYSATQLGEDLTLNFANLENSCNITLDLNGADFGYDDIVSFDYVNVSLGSCETDANSFKLAVTYLDCGVLKHTELVGSTTCLPLQKCYCDAVVSLCNHPESDGYLTDVPCYEPLLSHLYQQAQEVYNQQTEEVFTDFETAYLAKCAEAFASEKITLQGPFSRGQYTLFFYDQAGNLVRTVAPKGVTTSNLFSTIATSRTGTTGIDDQETPLFPAHTYNTTYKYNSYNQVVETTNPDHGGLLTKYWYDLDGRIIASQNPLQATDNSYSYIFYDNLGRPVETGQVVKTSLPGSTGIDEWGAAFRMWVSYNGPTPINRTEVTITQYDAELQDYSSQFIATGRQQNLRLRVASVFYCNTFAATSTLSTQYIHANHYSYDVHGNVIETVQETKLTPIVDVQQNAKSTAYEFELLSGNVKRVLYQKGKTDQLTHRYIYDKQNRLTEAFTSSDGAHESREAHYRYFDYGPLARVELGHYKVQGQDYAYTINGWIKGVNSNALDPEKDGGRDGATGTLQMKYGANRLTARDVTGYTLGYYKGDYKSAGTSSFEATIGSGNAFSNAIKDLYNGNITWTVNSITGFMPQAGVYQYDQLQRIKNMDVYRSSDNLATNTWATATATTEYHSDYSYDANGNLTHLNRNGISPNLSMDALVYNYTTVGGLASNRLNSVTDGIASGIYPVDIDNMTALGQVFSYDSIGQLTADPSQGISQIVWRRGDKKVQRFVRSSSASQIEFEYNPLGQRILKIVKPTTAGVPQANTTWKYTYYVYDANGQVMATYSLLPHATTKAAYLDEQMIYGASRIGVIEYPVNTRKVYYATDSPVVPVVPLLTINQLGLKRYELTNYLGNVNAVITDRKMPVDITSYFARFNGTNAYMSTSSINQTSSSLTIGAWMRSTSSATTASLFSHVVSTRGAELTIQNGKARLNGRLGSTTLISSGQGTTTVTDGEWHYVTGVVDGSTNTWKVYVDGILESSATNVGSVSPVNTPASIGRALIGSITYFNGDIKEVGYWNFAKTQAQIAVDMHTSYSTSQTGMIGYWPLTTNVSPATDISAAPHNASLVNGATYVAEKRYTVVVKTKADYYPFGMVMPSKFDGGSNLIAGSLNLSDYRYGYNGMEMDYELKGEGNSYTTEFRQYDPRLGRWLSLDPLMTKYPDMSPYVAFNNNPVYFIDPLGLEGGPAVSYNMKMPDDPNSSNQAYNDAGVTLTLSKNVDKDYDKWIKGIGMDGMREFTQHLYEKKLEAQDNWIAKKEHGKDDRGRTAFPQSVKDKLYAEAEAETVPALKSAWASKKAGYNGNFLNSTNPIRYIAYKRALALTVRTEEEGWDILTDVAIEVAIAWADRFTQFRQGPGPRGSNLSARLKSIKVNTVTKSSQGHVFPKKPQAGKLTDTPTNRQVVENLSNNDKFKLGIDEDGKTWYGQIREDGTQIYTYTKGGTIKGAGINLTPREFNPKTGLSSPIRGW